MYSLRKISLCHTETLNSKVVFTFSTHSHLCSLLYILQYGPKILKTLFHTFFCFNFAFISANSCKEVREVYCFWVIHLSISSFICPFFHSSVSFYIHLSISSFISPFVLLFVMLIVSKISKNVLARALKLGTFVGNDN